MTLRRLAVAAIFAVCLGAPIAEMFDQWDHTYQDGNDTEANLVVAALCVGIALSVAGVVIARVRAMSSRRAVDLFAHARERATAPFFVVPLPITSPPIPLRV